MTRQANARIAGFAFLIYIAAGLSGFAIARDAPVAALMPVFTSFSALVLGVTLFAITRSQDADLAMLAMVCRVVEGVPRVSGEVYFAVGSLLFSWLLLRGRMIPLPLAWVGVVASAILVVFVPSQLAGLFGEAGWRSPVTWVAWSPMLLFEVVLALWLILRGVAPVRQADARLAGSCESHG